MSPDFVLRTAAPIVMGLCAWNVLRRGSERAFVLPAPMMMWLIFAAQRSGVATGYGAAFAHAGAFAVLLACWRQQRRVAQWAVLGCAAATLWLSLSGLPS